MSQLNILAHPYAEALFNLAKQSGSESAWLNTLADLDVIVTTPEFSEILHNPQFDSAQIIAIVESLLKDQASAEVLNLLQLLAKNKRMQILGEIHQLFRKLVAEEQKRCDALIESAYAMSQSEVSDFEQLLSKKFAKTVTATVTINPELIGGIKVTINDKVIDASIQGRLNNLATQLTK